ncbi:hypothetical protein AN958_00147 [Leucoagaricus sp. SymC.cos]|nr:hypothetical protein AN958_00147 [Leucoagaricus sp. SymC.cos]
MDDASELSLPTHSHFFHLLVQGAALDKAHTQRLAYYQAKIKPPLFAILEISLFTGWRSPPFR